MKNQLISMIGLVFLLLVSCKPKIIDSKQEEAGKKEKEYTFINSQNDTLKVFIFESIVDSVIKKHYRYRFSSEWEEYETLIRYKESKDTFLELNPDYTLMLENGVGIRVNSILRFYFKDSFLHSTWHSYEQTKDDYRQYDPLQVKEITLDSIYYKAPNILYHFIITDNTDLIKELTYDQDLNLHIIKLIWTGVHSSIREYKLVQK